MKNAIITGASTGIGLELTRELLNRGYRVAMLARRADVLASAAADVDPSGERVLQFPLDVRDEAMVRAAVDSTVAAWGPIDLAIANAGIGVATPAERFSAKECELVMRTNVFGMLYLFGATVPSMVERRSGHFVGVASLAGHRGLPGSAIYSASKAAMQTFLEASRVELAPFGIAVTIVNPGFVKTPLTDKNKFRMPFLMSAGKAARIMASGIEKRKRVVEFPLPMSLLTRTLRHLPDPLFDFIVRPYRSRSIDESKVRR